jgi:hypothetical protein
VSTHAQLAVFETREGVSGGEWGKYAPCRLQTHPFRVIRADCQKWLNERNERL